MLESIHMKLLFYILVSLLATPCLAIEATFEAEANTNSEVGILEAEMWARPRTGARVAAMPAVKKMVRRLLASPDARLVIRYPGGEEGSLWAEELHVWLVALGIEAASMDMRPGSKQADQIELFIEKY